MLHDLVVDEIVHNLEPFDGLLFRDADVLLFQRHRSEAIVEVKETLALHIEERGDVFVVGQRGTEADETHCVLGRFDRANGSRDDRFEHRATVVVQEVHFVENDQTYQLGERSFAAFACDDVPLFRRADDQLRFVDLLARELMVTGQFSDFQTERVQALNEQMILLSK